MDIHITDALAAGLAKGKIFEDDISKGPQMPAPEWLMTAAQEKPGWIELGRVTKALPPFRILAHKVNLLVKKQHQGFAVRMSKEDLLTLRKWAQEVKLAGGDPHRYVGAGQ